MNDTLNLLEAHRSICSYSDAMLDQVIRRLRSGHAGLLAEELGRSDGLSWPQNLGNNLKQVYHPQLKPVAAMQGLLNDK